MEHKINVNRIILAVASIFFLLALTVSVFTRELAPLMGLSLIIFFLSPAGLLSMAFYNGYLKRRDKNRFLHADNSENLKAIIIYLAGFFVILLTPVILIAIVAIIMNFMHWYGHREDQLLIIPLSISIVIAAAYMIMLENRKKLDDIKAIETLKNSFLFMQLFTVAVIIFIALVVYSILRETTPDIYFRYLKYLLLPGIAGIFSMPYMLFFNVISHIARPKADPYNE
ncbi:MAG: hypothetical protein ABRQ37_08470 [Candidatus Eremiobacterota bacterium]